MVNIHLIRGALADLDQLRAKLEALQAEAEQSQGPPALGYKRPDGRLTEIGLQKLRGLIDAGHLDSEIARELEITQPAVLRQRRKYLAEKSAPRRRR